jgi:DNA-binding response OmpR family regulator
LPRLTEPTEASAPAENAPLQEPEPSRSHKVLVIDDEPAVLEVIRRFLEIAGHQAICAATGTEGLQLLRNGLAPDLVILDLMIPKENGVENFRGIRSTCAEAPILLCTGLVQNDLAQTLLEEGAASVLRKPFRMNELWSAVNQAAAK